ncbi:uncharacterized protein LOC116348330 [Contarinia nasturtii]|uniref:uncharacterized protein LOC116348330 n=1 Tax=Contarinia nasturtii TaxID=265458 RepID=UPI0012D40035|nr:uncharacterized protein LOC116348330 [Contarinia nasturtii]
MKASNVFLFVIGFVLFLSSMAVANDESANIAAALKSLFEKLSSAISKGDLKEVAETLQIADRKINEIIKTTTNEKIRKLLLESVPLLNDFKEKLSSNKVNLNDARAFEQKTKQKLQKILVEIST